MAATNPFRVSDLIAKYGWQIMPYLSNLGPMLLAEAQVLFVDSGHTNALDADDTEHGHSFEKPLATIDYAIGLCTAGERSVILAAPGHNDSLGDAQIDFDVSDITLIGIGEGTNKPRIDFDHANSSIDIGANNVHIINVTFMPSITDVLIGIDVEAAVTGTILEKCDFAEGEGADDEFIIGVDVKAGCTDTRIKNCLGRTKVAAAGCVAAVKFTGSSDNCIVEKCRFIGNYSTAAIVNDTGACTDLLIDDLTCKVKDGEPGIEVVSTTTGIIRNACIESTGTAVDSMIVAADMSWFNNFGVTVDGATAEIIGGGEVAAALNTAVTEPPTGKSLHDILHKDGSFTYDNTSDSLEAIADSILTGTDVLAGVNLDHLMKTVVNDKQNMAPEITDATVLAHILTKTDGSITDFDPTTDSLQAMSDKLGAFSGDGGAADDDSAKASLDILHTGVGTEFWVKKTLVSSAVVQGGVDVTGVSSTGELAIVDVVCKCDATGLAAGTNFELLTDNVKGLLNFYVETVANLGGAIKTVDLTNASVTNIRTVVETGKKVVAKATVSDCTGVGEVDVYIKFQRLTAGATIAAA